MAGQRPGHRRDPGQGHAARAAGADLVVVAVHAGDRIRHRTQHRPEVTAAQTLLASPDIDLVYGHHAHVVQPLQKINGKWVIYGLGNNIAAQETPVEGTHGGLLVRVTFSQDSTGAWTTSDIAWVPSLQNADPPYRWCSLTAGSALRVTGGRRRQPRADHVDRHTCGAPTPTAPAGCDAPVFRVATRCEVEAVVGIKLRSVCRGGGPMTAPAPEKTEVVEPVDRRRRARG